MLESQCINQTDVNVNDENAVHTIDEINDEITQNKYTQNKATMCDQINCLDAEIQCDSILKRSVAVQTLAQRKPRKQKKRKQSQNKGCQTPVRTKETELTLKPVKLFGGEVIQQLIPEQFRQDIDIDEDVSDEGDKDYVDEDDF